MKKTTLCFLLKDNEVLLAMKKRGFGAGKWNGVGGKLKEDETIDEAAVREIKEEIGVVVALKDLKNIGTLKFEFDGNPDWEQLCHVFTVHHWEGEPTESEEMRPQWYPIGKLQFDTMWVDDPYWLPDLLAGHIIAGEFLFDKNGDTLINHKTKIQ